jgi:hypothetical protein
MTITEAEAPVVTTEIQRIRGVGANAVYVVRRAGKRVATISRQGRSDWALESIHYREQLGTYRTLDQARSAAVARTSYPGAEEVHEAVCQRVQQQRRAWKRHEQMNLMFDAIQEPATGERGAGDRLVLLWRGIEAFAKDRRDTNEMERQHVVAGGDFRHGVPLYPTPPGERT